MIQFITLMNSISSLYFIGHSLLSSVHYNHFLFFYHLKDHEHATFDDILGE